MTKITRSLQRETAASVHSAGRQRLIVIELNHKTPTLLGLRLKGTKTRYFLPVTYVFNEAVRCAVAYAKAERKRQRAVGGVK